MMDREEALKFAVEIRDKHSYRLECGTRVPARSYYEKIWEMLNHAIAALREQEQREQGCDWCWHFSNDPQHLLSGGNGMYAEIIYKFCPMCGRKLLEPPKEGAEG